MSITFDNSKFLAAMKELTRVTGVELQTVMRWQMGLWTRDIILKIYSDPKASIAEQKKMGEKAIYSDLLGSAKHGETLFAPYDPSLAKPQERPLYNAVLLRAESGAPYMVDKAHFLPDVSPQRLVKIHEAHRDKRGRVRVPGPATRKAGGWTVSNAYTVPASTLKAYVKTIQARVGRGKASWLKAYDHFKQSVGMNLLPWLAPSWIRRHASPMSLQGSVGDRFDATTMTGEWYAGSDAEYGIDPQDAVNRTYPTRMKDLQSGHALRRLKGRIEAFSASRKAA